MFPIILSIVAIVFSTVILQMGNNMVNPVIVIRALDAGADLGYVALIPTAYGIGFLGGCFWGQKLIKQIGHIRSFAVAAALLAALAITMQLMPSTTAWIIIRGVMGCAIAVITTCADSWVGSGTPAALRGRVMGLYATVTKIAHVTAPALLAFSPFISEQAILLAGSLFALSLVPVAMTRIAAPVDRNPTKGLSFKALLRDAPSALMAAFVVGLTNGAVLNLIPAYGIDIKIPYAEVLALLSITHLGGLALQWPVGLLSDFFDRRIVMAFGFFIAASAALAIPVYIGQPEIIALSLAFLWGGTSLSIYSVALAHAIDHFEGDNIVTVCATMLVTWSIGSLLGPAVAGQFMDIFEAKALFQFSAAFQILAAVFLVFRIFKTVRRNRRTRFINVPISSGTIHSLDPRGE